MDKFLLISSVIIFVETRIKGKIDYSELATATGFSLPYVRELFACNMNKSQYRYKLERKIANAAFECCYTDKSLLEIGMEYGFGTADAFTRAFKRTIGVTPSEFRRMDLKVQRIKLCAGVYGVGLPAKIKRFER
jgi:AraC-like DNA-binding protein